MSLELDILTNRPKNFEINEDRFAEEQARLEAQRDVGLEVEQKLKTPEGKIFLDLVEDALNRRIDELAKGDPECQSLLNMIKALGGSIDLGRSAAQRMMENSLRMKR